MVPPSSFIPVAEDSGLIIELGAWVLLEGCRQAQVWREQGLDFGRLSVNVSGRQFQDEALRDGGRGGACSTPGCRRDAWNSRSPRAG